VEKKSIGSVRSSYETESSKLLVLYKIFNTDRERRAFRSKTSATQKEKQNTRDKQRL
jgi:hypothetical protein